MINGKNLSKLSLIKILMIIMKLKLVLLISFKRLLIDFIVVRSISKWQEHNEMIYKQLNSIKIKST